MLWAPTDNLRLNATLSWLDTDIDGFSTFDTADPNGMGTTEGVISCLGNNFLSDDPADCADTSGLSQGVPIQRWSAALGCRGRPPIARVRGTFRR